MNIVDGQRIEKKIARTEKNMDGYKKKVAKNQPKTFNLTSRWELGVAEGFVGGERVVMIFVSNLKSVTLFCFH